MIESIMNVVQCNKEFIAIYSHQTTKINSTNQ